MTTDEIHQSEMESIQAANLGRLIDLQWVEAEQCYFAISPFLFTWAILADLELGGYHRRWCFASLQEASGALKEWLDTGAKEPAGYIRRTH